MNIFPASYADLITSRSSNIYRDVQKLSINGRTKSSENIHIDIGDSCHHNGYLHSRLDFGLYDYPDVPNFLRGNPFIRTGYRVYLSRQACLKSLFIWSNETVNMWSHLIGFAIFVVLMLYDNLYFIPSVRGSLTDSIVMTIGLLCYQFCMLCSAGYHMFRCESERMDKSWFAYDLTGISVGLLGCYLPGVHFAFYCLSVWRDIYFIIITFLFAAVLLCQTRPQYYTNTFYWHRVILYCGLAGYGIIPTLHWIYLNGGFQTEIVQIFGPSVAVVYIFGILAFFFYITKSPEKCCPGHFDYVGSSHQIWHIIIVIAFLWWHRCGQELLQYQRERSCPVTE